MLLEHKGTQVSGSKTILSFMTEGGGQWERWDRFIALEGKKAFHIGNICGTCAYFFERLPGANQGVDPGDLRDALNSGLTAIDDSVLEGLKAIIPDGQYIVLLSEIRPALTGPGLDSDFFCHEQVDLYGIDQFTGLPHYPGTEYYRVSTRALPEGRGFFEFLVPTFPHGWLNDKCLDRYRAAFASGAKPTVLSLSVLDIKGPADWDGEKTTTEHWCLTHYLIDGHHKAYAATLEGKPLTLLSFLALDQGVASRAQHQEVVNLLGEGDE